MKIHELTPKLKKVARKRKGMGNATGNGTYGGRGMNGQNARAGGGVRLGFEGGQTPLIQRMPKMKGFKNPNRIEAQVVNLDALEIRFESGDVVNLETLANKKLVSSNASKVKILGNGEITKKISVEAGILVSGTAKTAIEKAGGSVVVIEKKKVEKAKK